MRETTLPSATGVCDLHVCSWECPEPRAVLQLVHGMSEYIQRYDEFARFLCSHGIAVVGFDNASHGQSRKPEDPWGYFGAEHGWDNLIADLHSLRKMLQEAYPGLPLFLMGHSMGSFLARSYAARHGEGIRAFIFMGTAGPNPALPVAKRLAAHEIKKTGGKTPCHKLDKLVAGAYNAAFKPNRTAFDWLSRNEERVDAYVNDAACGFPFTAAGYRDMFEGLEEISSKAWAGNVPKAPIMILSGTEDPVGGKDARGVKVVADRLAKSGHAVELQLYAHARHELLNETNRDAVMADILGFMSRVLAGA